MTNFKINNRTISLTSDQLLLTKQIAILGFASKSHINMLYSIIKGQQSLLSQHIFSKMVNKLHIWDSVSTSQKRNHTTITVYVLGRTGRPYCECCTVLLVILKVSVLIITTCKLLKH